MTRTCRECGLDKPATAEFFVRARGCRGGISHQCKTCDNAAAKAWRDANLPKIHERWRERYSKKHGEARGRRDRHYREHQPEKLRAMSMCKLARIRAAKLRLPYDLRWQDVLARLVADPCCECCRRAFIYHPPRSDRGGAFILDRSPTLDRFVPSAGYIGANVSILCWRCNTLKRDADAAELEVIAAWMRWKTPK